MPIFPHVRVKGDPYSRGEQYGKHTADRIKRNIEIYQEMFEHYAGWDWTTVLEHAVTYEPAIQAYRPHFLDEMRGIAAGSGLPYEAILALNLRTEIRNAGIARSALEGCTAFVALPNTTIDVHTLLGQNWDWKTEVRETVVVLEVEPETGPKFVTIVEAGLLAKIGMNSAGIGLTTNALFTDLDQGQPGVPYHAILRAILESSNFSEAIAAVNLQPRSSAANYLVAHQDGEAFNAEAAPGTFDNAFITFPKEGIYAHTNHFLENKIDFKDLGPWHGPGSLVRHHRMLQFLRGHKGELSVKGMQKVFADHFNHPGGICSHPDPKAPPQEHFFSVFSVMMDLNTSVMWLADGNPCETPYRRIDYSAFLR